MVLYMESEPKKKRRKLGRLEIKTKKIEKELAKIDERAAQFRLKLAHQDAVIVEPDEC